MVSDGEVYFSPPKKLNDPLDCSFFPKAIVAALGQVEDGNLKKALNDLLKRDLTDKVTGEKSRLLVAIEKRLANIGVLSFSLTAREPLMWTHYADEHKGICIGFDEKYIENWVDEENDERHLIGDVAVTYKEAPDFHEVLERYAKREVSGRVTNIDHLFGDLLMPTLRTKSKHWKYEQEVRLIRHQSGPLKVSPEAIREVIVGKRVSEPDRTNVRRILEKEW